MTRKLIFTGLFFILLAGIASGQVKNQRDAAGRKQGYWEATDSNGKLVYAGYFKDDKPVGEMKRYHPSGGIRVMMVYDEKSEKARAKFFWQNGEIAAEGNYINTKRDSVWTYYSFYNKVVSYRAAYKAGIRNGKTQSFYPNGVIAEEIIWKNDQKEGPWQQYFDNNQLKSSVVYKNDQLEGAFIAYYPDGKKETEGAYRNNLPDGKWIHYNNNGTVASTIQYVNGEITNLDELDAAEQEFFKNVEAQKDRIKEPTIEDLMREAQTH